MTETPQIGPRIKAIRNQKNLTLDALSERSGVSKSILSELERSKGNPTFATLWGVANALGVNLGDLTDDVTETVSNSLEVLQPHFTPEITGKDGNCTLRILGPTHMIGVLEWYEVTIAPNGSLQSEAHKKGTWEHLTATIGCFEVQSGDARARVEQGGTVRYPADTTHEIRNPTDTPAKGFLVVAST